MLETVTVTIYVPEHCQGLEDADGQTVVDSVYKYLGLYIKSVIAMGKPTVEFDEELFSCLDDTIAAGDDDELRAMIYDDCLFIIREIIEDPKNKDALDFISLHSVIQDVHDVLLIGSSPKMFIYKVGIHNEPITNPYVLPPEQNHQGISE